MDRSFDDDGILCSICLEACLLFWQAVSASELIRSLLSCSSVEQDEREEPGQDSDQRAENREPERNIDCGRFNHRLVPR